MAAVPVTIVGTSTDAEGNTTPVTIVGAMSITGLGVGGGPIIPPEQPPVSGPPGIPTHPIYAPPGIPTHPIVLPDPPVMPPDSPSQGKPPPPGGGWGWHPEYGWGYFPGGGGKPQPTPPPGGATPPR
jgi:hypothetical protein